MTVVLIQTEKVSENRHEGPKGNANPSENDILSLIDRTRNRRSSKSSSLWERVVGIKVLTPTDDVNSIYG